MKALVKTKGGWLLAIVTCGLMIWGMAGVMVYEVFEAFN